MAADTSPHGCTPAAAAPACWHAPDAVPPLGDTDAHVWRTNVGEQEGVVPLLSTLLDDAEMSRAARFRFSADRTRYVVAHGILRLLLGQYTGVDPRRVRFTFGAHGKPRLAQPATSAIDFNLSDTRGVVLIGIARGLELGVDVEAWDTMADHASVAESYFSHAERMQWRTLPPHARAAGFFACWTRKEAYIKATGLGISAGLHHFDVSLTPDAPACLLADRRDAHAVSTWMVHDLDVGPGYSGALVTRRAVTRVSCFSLEPDVVRRLLVAIGGRTVER